MATSRIVLRAPDGMAAASNTAGRESINLTSSSHPIPVLMFDGGSTNESIIFRVAFPDYASGNLTVKFRWGAKTATTGNVVWGAQLLAITPETDSGAPSGEAFGTGQTVQDAHLGTSAQRIHEASLTLSNTDSLAAGDAAWLLVYRNASDTTNDTLSGDAFIDEVLVEYTS